MWHHGLYHCVTVRNQIYNQNINNNHDTAWNVLSLVYNKKGLFSITKLCPTLILDMMSLPVDYLLRASNNNLCIVYAITPKHAFYGYSPEVRNLLEVTSREILKLDRIYKVWRLWVCLQALTQPICVTSM